MILTPLNSAPIRCVELPWRIAAAVFMCAALCNGDEKPAREHAAGDAVEQGDYFEKHVRPLLVENCLACHGEKKQEGGLRLDSRAAALKGGDSGAVILPEMPDESPLVEAIAWEGAIKMPPKKKLPDESISALAEWIRRGAPWPVETQVAERASASGRHWAFQPIVAVAPPQVRQAEWPLGDIDRFLLAKLEQHGLRGGPLADRRTLIRRATFDLVGLPPTPDDVAAFESDRAETPLAFAKVVDRLLDSPHYGERWGRYWLDVARYADNKGYIFFEEPSFPWAHTYRDWVIRSFNDDLPYDQFLVQQLAADQLPLGGDSRPLAALGFLTVGGHFMNNVHDVFDDRIDVVSRGLLGLTVTCARCHDHKYDPIPQADYYSLYGIFRSSSEPLVPPRLGAVPATEQFEQYELGLAERRLALERYLDGKQEQLVSGARSRVAEYLMAAYASRDQPTTEDFMLLIPKGDVHPLVVQRYWLHLQRTRRQHDPVWGVWHAFAAIPESEFAASAPMLCAQLQSPQPEDRPLNPLVVEAVCSKPPESMNDVAQRYSALLNGTGAQGGVDQQSIANPAVANPGSQNPDSQKQGADAPRSPEEQQLWLALYGPDAPANVPRVAGWGVLTLLPDREAQAEYQKLLKDLEQWMIHGPHAPPRAMVLVDEATPYEPKVFLRGNPNRAGDSVSRRFLSALAEKPSPFTQGSGRLELARAIVDPANPLTARVVVNRVWQQHFGKGLVKTPSDFGVRSDPPSHPELLDFLAANFVEQGWSIKWLHRQIMLSAAYLQSSAVPAGAESIDPENRLLSHVPRRRLDFESLRDSMLAVAGTLDPTVGGPAVNLLAGAPRRTVYGFIDRLALPGLLRTFDFPSSDSTSPGRDQTTVAPQALYLMNGPFVQDCANKLAARPDIAGEADLGRRVDRLHRLLFARPATEGEQRLASEFLGSDGDAAPLWVRYVQALLLTNEFAFVD